MTAQQQNKYIAATEEEIERIAREQLENGKERLKIRTTKLASLVDVPDSTLRNNGYPHKLERIYDSIDYVFHKGLYIESIEDYIEEREQILMDREKRKKDERLKEIQEETIDIGAAFE